MKILYVLKYILFLYLHISITKMGTKKRCEKINNKINYNILWNQLMLRFSYKKLDLKVYPFLKITQYIYIEYTYIFDESLYFFIARKSLRYWLHICKYDFLEYLVFFCCCKIRCLLSVYFMQLLIDLFWHILNLIINNNL